MKQHFKLFLFFICLFGSLKILAQQNSPVDWKSDIEFLKKELPLKHKNFFFQYPEASFNRDLDQLISVCSGLSDLQVALKLQQIVVKAGDAHSGVEYYKFMDKKFFFAVSSSWLSDGLFILATSKGNREILGTKLEKINGTPIETIVDSLSTLFVVDNDACKKVSIPNLIRYPELLEYFGFGSREKTDLTVISPDGSEKIHSVVFKEDNDSVYVEFKPDTLPFYRRSPEKFFNEKYFEQDSIYFVQYNRCWSKELEEGYGDKTKAAKMPSFVEFEQTVFKTIREKPIKKLIVDLRFNSGGSSLQGTDFVKQLAGMESINRRNKIYVVIGKRTFSSAIINVMDFKRYTKAVTIGEETSGSPNHFGELKTFSLPSSQLKIAYSTKYFKLVDGKGKSIVPDIKCATGLSDVARGVDPVYEYLVGGK